MNILKIYIYLKNEDIFEIIKQSLLDEYLAKKKISFKFTL